MKFRSKTLLVLLALIIVSLTTHMAIAGKPEKLSLAMITDMTGPYAPTLAPTYSALLDAAGQVDILVNNPGVRQVPTPYDEITIEDWRYWLEVHFLSSVQMIQAVAPKMKDRKFGRIVNMSVSFIKFPQVGFAHSHAARLALSGATAAMSRDLVPHNVTINTVCPGLFDTDALHTNLHGHAKRGNTTYEAIVQDRIDGCPAGRFADPSECGDLIAFLCSAQAGFITGQNIINDGGIYQGLF